MFENIVEIYELSKLSELNEKKFEKALTNLGIDSKKYVKPHQIKATKGKNIVVIILESIEQGYLNFYPDYTPNLNVLSQELTYYKNFYQEKTASGGSNTLAAIYSFQTGTPLIGLYGMKIFKKMYSFKLTSLGDILSAANYDSRFIMSKPGYAGKNLLLKKIKYNVIEKHNRKGNYGKNFWGGDVLHDRQLFNEAKLHIKEQLENNRPFATFILGIDSHFPGHLDKSMQKFVGKEQDKILFSVKALDFLIGDFIKFLKKENIFDDTAIFIFPDHNQRGKNSVAKFIQSDRPLFLISNIDEEKIGRPVDSKLHQIDIPRLILSGAGVNTNATFLVDYIKEDVYKFVSRNIDNISVLNKSSVLKNINTK